MPAFYDSEACFRELKSKSLKPYGLLVFLGRAITENDLFAKLVDSRALIDDVPGTLNLLANYLELLQAFKIGNVVRIEGSDAANFHLQLVAPTPSAAIKNLQKEG